MPPDPSTKSRKRSLTPRRGAIACVRCKERKAKCTPAPPGASRLPTCMNCLNARAPCVYLDRTPNEIFLLEYVSQLETRVATLEMELSKYNPSSSYAADHSSSHQARTAAVDALTQQYPQGPYIPEPSPEETGLQNVSESRQRRVTDDENDELALGVGMLSLSGLGDPLYLGASSGVNWARVCATALRRPNTITTSQGRFAFQAPPESASAESALSYGIENPIPPLPPPHLADQYFDMVYNHVQAQYSFLDWHALQLWHRDRDNICLNRPIIGSGQGTDHARGLAAFMLWLVYGYGARLMEERKVEGAVSHEVYYSAAVACLSTLTSHHSLATVQCLLLLETYSIWHARSEISTWQVAGLALRTAIELGLHRRTRSRSEREKDPLRYEMKKRVFWTVYTMDRMIALQLGRPSGIADKDIDIEFPLNIDLQVTDPKHIFEMQNRQIEITKDRYPGAEYTKGYDQVNSMTSSIHNIRLNQLKQLIQDTIYRLDKPRGQGNDLQGLPGSRPIPEIEAVLQKLNEWRACRPIQPPNAKPLPLLSEEQLGLDYHECVQMLLRPIIAIRQVATYYAPLCAESAASCCETDVFAPNSPSLRLVTWQLYRLFLSGLTLLHLVSSPTTQHCISHDRASHALHRSLHTIGHLVKLFPGAAPYESILSELVRGWESRHEGHIHPPARPVPVNSTSHASGLNLKASPGHENGGPHGTMNPNATNANALENRHMNWAISSGQTHTPQSQTSHAPQASSAAFDGDWMTALLNSNEFGQDSSNILTGHMMMNGQNGSVSGSGSGSASGSSHGHGLNGQNGFGAASGCSSSRGHGVNGQQTLTEDMGPSWTPLFGSPRSTEAFSDQWGGTLIQMGGQVTGPVRDDFFSLLSSFGLETIVESANEASLPLTDGPVWQPPGLDNLILGNQPVNPPPAMPDFTTMGMGEFLDWSQRTGRMGQYEAYTANPGQGGSSDSIDEQRGRQ